MGRRGAVGRFGAARPPALAAATHASLGGILGGILGGALALCLAGAALGGCGPRCPDGPDGPEGLHCRGDALLESHVSAEALAAVLEPPPDDGSLDAALRALLPALEGHALADLGETDPVQMRAFADAAGVPLDVGVVGLDAHRLSLPVDWSADPHGDDSWRLYFQALHWLTAYTGGSDADRIVAGYLISDWVRQELYRAEPLRYTWYDHALGRRADRVAALLERQLAERDTLDRGVVHACVQVLVTHLYAMADPERYAPRHNHGVMLDVSLLENAPRLPGLVDGPALLALAETRLEDQIEHGVSADGIHAENSPGYQLLFAELLTRAAAGYEARGAAVPFFVAEPREALLAAFVHLLQPDLSPPQFGDTADDPLQEKLGPLLASARAHRDTPGLRELEWVLSGGDRGEAPEALDAVYAEGGVAAFRSTWSADDAVTGHFTCNHRSAVHYHPDETGFEIHGYGHSLVVDTGHYNYDESHRFTAHQYAAAAHNVLVIDGRPFEALPEPGDARITGHRLGPELSWVRGTHGHYAGLGARDLQRTFVHVKPDAFLFEDSVRLPGVHRYEQHLHLDPRLTDVRRVDGRTVLARSNDGGPSLAITAFEAPDSVRLIRGLDEGGEVQGWRFPRSNVAEPATDVVLGYRRDGPRVRLPVLVQVVPPGIAPAAPEDVSWVSGDEGLYLTWRAGGVERSARLPR